MNFKNILSLVIFMNFNMFNTFLIKNFQKFNILNKIHNENVILNNNIVAGSNHKIIYISPGGFKGFYELGVCKYIKENYNLDDYVFSGSSAGAWNSLVLCYKGKFSEIEEKLLDENIYKTRTIFELQKFVTNKILTEFKTEEFDLDKLYIGATTIKQLKKGVTIFTSFTDLEDAVNCCIASSHIPFVTGGYKNIYRNHITLDGGFSRKPFLDTDNIVLNITPNIWKDENNKNKRFYNLKTSDFTTLFSRNEFNFIHMFEEGYKDSKKNKEYLDNLFRKNDYKNTEIIDADI